MRHVPSSDTAHAGVLSFEEALVPTASDFDRSRWIYVPDHYSEYRYLLGTRGSNPLVCIGINPSTAIPDRLDNTLKSAERIALHNGYDSFVMFNVYAQRATDPNAMDRSFNAALHAENMAAWRYVLSRYGAGRRPAVWAAWGTLIEKRGYLIPALLDMIAAGEEAGAEWYTFGKRSKAGHPHHPLYLRADSAPDPFDVRAYCETLERD